MRHAEYMTCPRAFAISEDLWSQKENKNWNNFVGKVEKQFARYDVAQIKYAPSMYDPVIDASISPDKKLIVELSTEIDSLDIYYTFDNSFPDRFYPKYIGPIIVPEETAFLKLITYRNGKPIGRMITVPVTELKAKAAKKE